MRRMVQAGSIGAIWIETVAVEETCFLALKAAASTRILGFDVGSFHDGAPELCGNSGCLVWRGVQTLNSPHKAGA
jgi:hypothetical protein